MTDINQSKIFSIGFGKCGTQTVHLFLRKNLNSSVHGGEYMKHWFLTGNIHRIAKRARCYVYDSMCDPFNIDFTIKYFPDAHYILPTRNFVHWLISVAIHYDYKEITPKIIYDFLMLRNNYYFHLQSLKIKNFRVIDIENDNICQSLLCFLPKNARKYYKKKGLLVNRTPSKIMNKEALKEYILTVLDRMNISVESAKSHMIVYDRNGNHDIKWIEDERKFALEYCSEMVLEPSVTS